MIPSLETAPGSLAVNEFMVPYRIALPRPGTAA